MSSLNQIKHAVNRWKIEANKGQGALAHLCQQLLVFQETLARDTLRLENAKQAQGVIQKVARATQATLEYKISELATLAMDSVLEEPYELAIQFENKRGKTAARLVFVRGEDTIPPIQAGEGGAIDIAALGLRFALWALMRPRSRNVMILDEPLHWLKGGNMPMKGAQMIQEISKKLGLQIIMVSHSPELIKHADKVVEL